MYPRSRYRSLIRTITEASYLPVWGLEIGASDGAKRVLRSGSASWRMSPARATLTST